jgi:hypothetical protein
MPVPGSIREAPECGTIGLHWSQRPKDIQGFTAVPSKKSWAYPISRGKTKSQYKQPGAEPGSWKDIRPGDSVSLAMELPFPKPGKAARVFREGKLMHLGFSVALQEPVGSSAEDSTKGSADTSAVVTLFSDYFGF